MPKPPERVKIDGHDLTLSNVGKIYFPETGFTKGETIAFYSEIADIIVPHLRDRPLTMKRTPEGVTGESFYEKNAPKHTPAWIKTFAVPRSEGGPAINYILCNERATLLWTANLGDIEKHVLLARAPKLNEPTSLVFDLDPGPPAGILECGAVALHLKKLFAALGLEAFVKVSGSKGLHLSVPLNSGATYEVTQPFAKAVAELGAQQLPKLVVSEMAKSLRQGKVLIDWSQNSDFKTTVAVYALRAKNTAPFVSLPITWEELERAVKRKKADVLFFTPAAALKRIKKLGDLFAPVLKLRQQLPAAFTQALASGPAVKLSRWPRNTKEGPASKDKSLREYTAKRDFQQTAEPPAEAARKSKASTHHRFVIQKHAASHLHYDWRLEMEGVLRSWAVPKGPPTELREARLAMHVEDHPLAYEKFEGTIPKGNYGGGTVMVWDYGLYDDITGDAAGAFREGKMHVVLKGQKLNGEWIMVKDKREPKSNKWLLIKAGKSMRRIPAKIDDSSAISGRSMAAIAQDNDAQWESSRPSKRERGGNTAAPKFVEPMKCKAVAKLPEEADWTFEIKFDGYRCIAVKDGDEARLFSRNEKELNARFPNVAEALAKLQGDFVLDGEIVALDDEGRPSFQLLQNSVGRPLAVYYYAFDLLHLKGESFLHRPIAERREQLQKLLRKTADPLRLSPLLDAPAGQVLDAVRKLGLEGVVGKRAGSVYEAGERSGAWIKQRADRAQEFVIGGYVPGTRGFDSLLVGVYEKKQLKFVAKVKDGFVPRLREEVFAEFAGLETAECPFVNLPEKKNARRGDPITAEKMKECRWLKPTLVTQVAFVEWTDAGNLRHAKFIALRDDKKATAVVRET
ncbi:MAG: non-homologous end-joining DNA ligase [Chthoniobacterales bacterium]